MQDVLPQNPTFAQLQIDPRIVAAVTELGFCEPTPIQARAIPPLLEGRDLVARARTGSGKTAAFGLPLLHLLSRGSAGTRALVLAPTRELAVQITVALRSYADKLRLEMVTLYGGAGYRPQLLALHRGVDVVVGTPGRLRDHLERGSLDLSTVELVVIDEADEMLRMGFVEDLTRLLQATPDTRQVALFSATMPAPIRQVAQTYLREPLEVHVEQDRISVAHIEQYRIDVPDRHKTDVLVRVLKSGNTGATLIFSRTRLGCDELAEALRDRGFDVRALHGNMSQSAREEVLRALRTRRLDLVVATDVAARGIDVEHLTHVINFDMPEEVEVYVNRIGRTGRAGRAGVATSLVNRRDQGLARRIEQRIKNKLRTRPVPSDAQIVRQQRADLETELQATLQQQTQGDVAALRAVLQQRGWSVESLCAAALGLVLRDRRLEIEAEPSEEPPVWARPPKQQARATSRGLTGRQRAPRTLSASGRHTLGAAVGREHGISPSDVVGALANELGVPPGAVGRITIFDRNLTVALSEEAAAHLAQNPKVIYLRGEPVTFTRPKGTAPGWPRRAKTRGKRSNEQPERPRARRGRPGGVHKAKGKNGRSSNATSNERRGRGGSPTRDGRRSRSP
jgi:ATP-dependent RNA helicase DeaD